MSTRGALLVCSLLACPMVAQVEAVDEPPARRAAGRSWWRDGELLGGFLVHYGAAQWRDGYAALVDGGPAGAIRLGKGSWTTLDAGVPLDLAGTRVPPGTFYLALHKDPAGTWGLLAFPADAVRDGHVPPSAPDRLEPLLRVPLELARDREPVDELDIRVEFADDDPLRGRLVLAWGPYRLTAELAAAVTPPAERRFDTALDAMIGLLEAGEHRTFVETYADPRYLARAAGGLDAAVAAFGSGERPAALLRALRAAREAGVDVAADQEVVELPGDDLPRPLRFRWIEGRWRLLN